MDTVEEGGHRTKRFKHQSYNDSLRDVHLPSALTQKDFDRDMPDDGSHFHEALEHWQQLNLSPAFLQFAKRADGLSASMPLLLHHWKDVYDLWMDALKVSDHEGLPALFDLLQKLVHDLRITLKPIYLELFTHLLEFLKLSLPAAGLTSLLATLSALMKYILIPCVSDTDDDLLVQTWTAFCAVVPKCHSEVQRAAAETWGSTLRRQRTTQRERSIELMFAGLEGVEDVCAWAVVYACKSVVQTLHTNTPQFISALLTHHLTSSELDRPRTHAFLRRVFTALTHHCPKADAYAPVADCIVQRFTEVVESGPASDSAADEEAYREKLRRMLDICGAVVSVRKGSRMTQTHLLTLLNHFPSLPLSLPSLRPSILAFTTAILQVGEMALWMGAGRKTFERAWEADVRLALLLTRTTAELEWGGWKAIALPYVWRRGAGLLSGCAGDVSGGERKEEEEEDLAKMALRLLASLSKSGRLDAADATFREKLGVWSNTRLGGGWQRGEDEEKDVDLENLFLLSSKATGVTPSLVRIIDETLRIPDPRADYSRTCVNAAWVVGSALKALAASSNPAEWTALVRWREWVQLGVEKWGWSSFVLGGLGSISKHAPSDVSLPFTSLYPHLKPALLSHSRETRLRALRLLSSRLVTPHPEAEDVLKRCLAGEEVTIDVQGVRERVVRIGRVGQVVKDKADGGEDQVGADLCGRWLISQLKVNLRPVWSPASGALSTLSSRFGELVWGLLLSELSNVHVVGEGEPPWMAERDDEEEDLDDVREDERSWRDPNAHKVRTVLAGWAGESATRSDIVNAQILPERLDRKSLEAQLLLTLGEMTSLVEQHNRELVPLFLSFAGPEAASKPDRQRLSSWLTLFSKFTNPKALYATDTLFSIYTALLAHPDRSLQSVALSCILAYKSPHLLQHEGVLRGLLDETRWRDVLTSLELMDTAPQEREELVGVFVRLSFGLMLDRRGKTKGADRRAALLGALTACVDTELALLVVLMLQPLKIDDGLVAGGVSDRQKVGFLNLLGDALKHLRARTVHRWDELFTATIALIRDSQTKLDGTVAAVEEVEGDDNEDEAEADEKAALGVTKATRTIRQLGFKRLTDFFRCPSEFDFQPYMAMVCTHLISPRLALLDQENTQSPSSLLNFFQAWSEKVECLPFFVDYDKRILPKVYQCLVATTVKPPVVSRIFDIVDNILNHSESNPALLEKVLKPDMSSLLSCVSTLVERTKGTEALSTALVQREISMLSRLAPYLEDAAQARVLLALFTPLLKKSSKVVPEKVKSDLLDIVANLLTLIPDVADCTSAVHTETYDTLSVLFQTARSRYTRAALVAAFKRLGSLDGQSAGVAALLEELNSYSAKRVDEPDVDRRLLAFAQLNEQLYTSLTSRQWLPVIYNMLSFIQDPDELAIRNNASFALRRFVDVLSSGADDSFETVFLRVLFTGLKNGLRSRNEHVRSEVLGVIAYATTKCPSIEALSEMRVLLADGDEEANFFNNILHVQTHRRTRAVHRLADKCDEGCFRSVTLADVFIPLLNHFIVAGASADHHLLNEAIISTGRLAKHLAWGAYNALVNQHMKLAKAKGDLERYHVRTLVALLNNFHFPMHDLAEEVIEEVVEEEEDPSEVQQERCVVPSLNQRISDAVNSRLLPNLLRFLENREETEDNLRIPISVGIVKVALHLPGEKRDAQISRLLTAVSQILRSKSQDTRDLVRETMCKIAVTLGPTHLPAMLRELRGALLRGPHLHILAHVTHALLVFVTSSEHIETFANLDESVPDVVHIAAEVVFGSSAKDVQSEDFKTKMREVRGSSSKGLDTFAIISKHITPARISGILSPLKSMMQETEALKTMQLVDEVLRRVAGSLNSNKYLVPTELLVLCHTLITQNARFLQEVSPKVKKGKKGDAIVQVKRKLEVDGDHYAHNSFRFVTFGLELFVTACRRSRFDFKDSSTISRLEPMVAVIGNTLYSDNAQVTGLGLKAAAAIVKCPLKSIEKSLPVFIRQTLDIIKQAGSTEPEVVQIAFRTLSTIFRDCSAAEVKETDLTFLLELISPDLEEPERQSAIFPLLRAILSRKFVVPEIYDMMDKIAEMMVTNQSPQVQEFCRGALLQFLLDYPQGKGRLKEQMVFFAKNLTYVHESGRKSVLELLSAIFNKFETNLLREYSDLFFVSLVMILANDDSTKCREMGAELIKTLLRRLDDAQRRVTVSHLHSWSTQHANPQLERVASQVYGLVLDTLQGDTEPFLSGALEDLNALLIRSASELNVAENNGTMEVDLEWQSPYHALTTIAKALRIFPDRATQSDQIAWPSVIQHLLYPHAWVRTASCRLLGVLFSAVPVEAPSTSAPEDSPLSRLGMEDIAKKLCMQLKSENLDETLGLQVVKTLFYIGKCFHLVPKSGSKPDAGDDEDESDEEPAEPSRKSGRSPLAWLFSKMSYQARFALTTRRNKPSSKPTWVNQPLAVIRWFAAMVTHLTAEEVERFLTHVLSPLYRITEDDTIRDPKMDELKTTAVELQDLLQKKVSATQFTEAYSRIRQNILGVRRDRKAAKVLQIATNPQAGARRKMQKNQQKKDSRKRKHHSFVDSKYGRHVNKT